ncbi:ArsR/SmtB family transcription factor [Acetobacterium carbinolicum]|uniref:ArsR/SmtB family transcription factor n=1 Tax=Acetobacterium carbinolicum TaxID=52690 RepID=UPI0039BF8472
MNSQNVLKAIADESRMKIIELLLQHNYCVRALSRRLKITEAAISQHLKVLREAGLLTGERKGYYVHYHVNRDVLKRLSSEIFKLSEIEETACAPGHGGCEPAEQKNCRVKNE